MRDFERQKGSQAEKALSPIWDGFRREWKAEYGCGVRHGEGCEG
jgi:hypothetical protein